MKADYVHKDTRTIVVDGVEIQTSLTAVEIASLQQENQQLKEQLQQKEDIIDKAKEKLDKANKKIENMFDNGNENRIIDDLLELQKILDIDKGE